MSTTLVMKIVPPYTPELLPGIQNIIEKWLSYREKPIKVLELGSGWSTIWFAQLGCDVISFEHDIGWYQEVWNTCTELNLQVDLRLINDWKFPIEFGKLDNNQFDLIYIDCIDEQRVPCGMMSVSKLKQGGCIIVDDSHWPILQGLIEELNKHYIVDCICKGVHIRKTGNTAYHQTTIYIK